MNLSNITWEEAQNASRLEKSLISRTEELNQENISMMQLDTLRDKNVSDLTTELAQVKETQEQYKNEVHLLQLFMMQKITPDQFTTLRKMLYSVDKENHVVAIETINNLIKEL